MLLTVPDVFLDVNFSCDSGLQNYYNQPRLVVKEYCYEYRRYG